MLPFRVFSVFTLVTKNWTEARGMLWKGWANGRGLAGNWSFVFATVEAVVPVTYMLPDASIVIPLAVSVPLPERYDEYNNTVASNCNSVTNAWVPALSGVAWYALVAVVGKLVEEVVPATNGSPRPSTRIPTGLSVPSPPR